VTEKTRVIYLNSPHNPTGGVLKRMDLEAVAALARRHDLWIVSDEAYEDVVFGVRHISPASLAGMYPRTIPVCTFSKTYAMTGLRLGYMAIADRGVRDRVTKLLFYTTSNVSSVVQYGGIGALEGSQDIVEEYRAELEARRDLFYEGLATLGGVFAGAPPSGAFYAFVRFLPEWKSRCVRPAPKAKREYPELPLSPSWEMTEYLISQGRIGCIPGGDFGPGGEGYLRFCFARDRLELGGALASMRSLFVPQGA
jgi:aspartate aminotransferase